MITIKNIGKAYNGQIVVDIPRLQIKQGIVGLVGNNGAGKTTLFRLILDLIKADRGEILSMEKPVSGNEEWKQYTAAYLDEGFLIQYLTPEEYFYFVGKLHNRSKADVDEYLLLFTNIFDSGIFRTGKYIRDLSKGNQLKVGIAACILQNPEILILDEPFANLDPSTQIRLMQLLKEIQVKKRMTILISSHDLNNITDLCGRILLMEKGKIIKDLQTSDDTLNELEEYFKV
ncbi:MAG: ABC transporter ATP-binding protein [Chitinophagaceae bacterium]